MEISFMIKKMLFNCVKILLIISPIIVLSVSFIRTFWGPIYKINVNSDNIAAIEETLNKDNIEIEYINDVTQIELCGQGLWDYESLNFYYNNGKIKSVNLYITEQHYYIYEYLYNNTFNDDDIFKISIFISLATIGVTVYDMVGEKRKSQ